MDELIKKLRSFVNVCDRPEKVLRRRLLIIIVIVLTTGMNLRIS